MVSKWFITVNNLGKKQFFYYFPIIIFKDSYVELPFNSVLWRSIDDRDVK